MSRKIVEVGLGVSYEKRLALGVNALENPIEPILVDSGPCKENILKDDSIDLSTIPFITWSAGLDGGPFHTSGAIITKDFRTGKRNVAVYRMNVKGKDVMTLNVGGRPSGGTQHLRSWQAEKKPMPVAIALGVDPVITMVGTTNMPVGFDELSLASGLKKEPIPLVKCSSIDMEVPANAEIVLEGEVVEGDTVVEGQWGEAAGYMTGEEKPKPAFRVKCITHRNNAIYQAYLAAKPPNEVSYSSHAVHESRIYHLLTNSCNIQGILDLTFTKPSVNLHLVIKMKPMYPGHVKHVLQSAGANTPRGCKYVTAVDEDIDIYNLEEIEWAHCYRVQPARDVIIISGTPVAEQDLSSAEGNWRRTPGSRMLIDATKKWEYPPTALPPKEHLEKVRTDWESYGLPSLSPSHKERVTPILKGS